MNKLLYLLLFSYCICFSQPEVNILKKGKSEVLQFKSKTINKIIQLKKLDFYDEDTSDQNFIVVSYSFQKNKNRVVLGFSYPSNDENHAGYCGAGTEAGFIVFNLDSKYNITSKKRILIESCFNNIENEVIKKTEFIEEYKVSDNKGITRVSVNKRTAEITIKNE